MLLRIILRLKQPCPFNLLKLSPDAASPSPSRTGLSYLSAIQGVQGPTPCGDVAGDDEGDCYDENNESTDDDTSGLLKSGSDSDSDAKTYSKFLTADLMFGSESDSDDEDYSNPSGDESDTPGLMSESDEDEDDRPLNHQQAANKVAPLVTSNKVSSNGGTSRGSTAEAPRASRRFKKPSAKAKEAAAPESDSSPAGVFCLL